MHANEGIAPEVFGLPGPKLLLPLLTAGAGRSCGIPQLLFEANGPSSHACRKLLLPLPTAGTAVPPRAIKGYQGLSRAIKGYQEATNHVSDGTATFCSDRRDGGPTKSYKSYLEPPTMYPVWWDGRPGGQKKVDQAMRFFSSASTASRYSSVVRWGALSLTSRARSLVILPASTRSTHVFSRVCANATTSGVSSILPR